MRKEQDFLHFNHQPQVGSTSYPPMYAANLKFGSPMNPSGLTSLLETDPQSSGKQFFLGLLVYYKERHEPPGGELHRMQGQAKVGAVSVPLPGMSVYSWELAAPVFIAFNGYGGRLSPASDARVLKMPCYCQWHLTLPKAHHMPGSGAQVPHDVSRSICFHNHVNLVLFYV